MSGYYQPQIILHPCLLPPLTDFHEGEEKDRWISRPHRVLVMSLLDFPRTLAGCWVSRDCGDAGDMSDSKGVSVWETEGSKLHDGAWGQALRCCSPAPANTKAVGDGSRVRQLFHVWLPDSQRGGVPARKRHTALSLCAPWMLRYLSLCPFLSPRYSPHCSHPGTMSSTPFLQGPHPAVDLGEQRGIHKSLGFILDLIVSNYSFTHRIKVNLSQASHPETLRV